MSEEKNDKETEQKAERMNQLSKKLAEQHASAFEDWLKEHQDSTKDEAHERLVKTIEAAMVLYVMMFMVTV